MRSNAATVLSMTTDDEGFHKSLLRVMFGRNRWHIGVARTILWAPFESSNLGKYTVTSGAGGLGCTGRLGATLPSLISPAPAACVDEVVSGLA